MIMANHMVLNNFTEIILLALCKDENWLNEYNSQLSPILNKFQPEAEIKLVHTQALNITQQVMFESEDKADLPP